MARKTLLTEGEIRQFMKLAKLPAVGNSRLTEFVGPAETTTGEEDSLEEIDIAEEEEEVDLSGEEEAPELDVKLDGDDADGAEMDLDMGDPDVDMNDSVDVDAEELVTRIAHDLESLARMAGVDVDVEDDAPSGEDDLELDAELGPVEDPEGDELPGDDEMPGMRDGGYGGSMMEEEEIVQEVARRVASRLQAEESRSEMVSTLAERILNRITNTK